MPFRGALLTSCTNREVHSMENREGGLEPKHTGVRRAKEGGNVTNSQPKTEERAARAERSALQGVRGGKAGEGGRISS